MLVTSSQSLRVGENFDVVLGQYGNFVGDVHVGLTGKIRALEIIADSQCIGVGRCVTEMVEWVISIRARLYAASVRVVDGQGKMKTAFPAASCDLPACVLLCRLVKTRQIAAFYMRVVFMLATASV
jgi:hypothetical protein